MRRFLAHVGGFLAIQFAILAALNAFYMQKVQRDHYLLAWIDKAERLRRTPSPRLIICGGSSSAFGLDSPALERAVGRPVVNLGLHGGLSLEFMLRQVEAAVGKGDLVVLAPEYEILQDGGQRFAATTVLDLLSLTTEPLRFLDSPQLALALDRGLDLIAKRPRAFYTYLQGRLEPQPSHLRRSGFNAYGDVVAHRGKEPDEPLTDRVASRITVELVTDAIPRIRRFVDTVHERGGEVCLVPPPIPQSSYTAYKERLDPAWAAVVHGVGGCSLSEQPLAYPDSTFFLNNGYHMTLPKGATLRTNDLIARLEAAHLTWTPVR